MPEGSAPVYTPARITSVITENIGNGMPINLKISHVFPP